jgi:hypothetical protein
MLNIDSLIFFSKNEQYFCFLLAIKLDKITMRLMLKEIPIIPFNLLEPFETKERFLTNG